MHASVELLSMGEKKRKWVNNGGLDCWGEMEEGKDQVHVIKVIDWIVI